MLLAVVHIPFLIVYIFYFFTPYKCSLLTLLLTATHTQTAPPSTCASRVCQVTSANPRPVPLITFTPGSKSPRYGGRFSVLLWWLSSFWSLLLFLSSSAIHHNEGLLPPSPDGRMVGRVVWMASQNSRMLRSPGSCRRTCVWSVVPHPFSPLITNQAVARPLPPKHFVLLRLFEVNYTHVMTLFHFNPFLSLVGTSLWCVLVRFAGLFLLCVDA